MLGPMQPTEPNKFEKIPNYSDFKAEHFGYWIDHLWQLFVFYMTQFYIWLIQYLADSKNTLLMKFISLAINHLFECRVI